MANCIDGWLSAAACQTGQGRLAPVARAQFRDLSPRHRREVAALIASGLTSTALVLSAVMFTIPDDIVVPSVDLRVELVAAPALSSTLPALVDTRRARAPRAVQPRVLQAFAVPAGPRDVPVAPLTAWANRNAFEGEMMDRPGGFVRVLLGDGRHRVRPFPRPAAQN